MIHVWDYNRYCRLGLCNQVDALRPKQVPQFTGANAGILVAAGPSNSVVVDRGVSHVLDDRQVGKLWGQDVRLALPKLPVHARYHRLQNHCRSIMEEYCFRKHGGRDKVMVEGVQETSGDGWCSRNIDKNFKIRLA
ncbi:hypothetical protein IW262DRAFT_546158 [Armillaria fumosa]|nr:hypothetical protein IW262DRAFT_546158 [Armillaria fumosa]